MIPTASAPAAPPNPAMDGDVEMGDLPNGEPKLLLHKDIMQLSRLGDIGPIQELFSEGIVGSGYRDEEGITPLHVSPEALNSADCPV